MSSQDDARRRQTLDALLSQVKRVDAFECEALARPVREPVRVSSDWTERETDCGRHRDRFREIMRGGNHGAWEPLLWIEAEERVLDHVLGFVEDSPLHRGVVPLQPDTDSTLVRCLSCPVLCSKCLATARLLLERLQQRLGGKLERPAEERACGMLVGDPSLTIKQVANELGVNRTSVYRWPKFMRMWRAKSSAGSQPPRGHKSTGVVEAHGSGSVLDDLADNE